MKLNLSCADFSFPLLSHEAACKVVALLGLRGLDVGLFAGRSHLRPEVELCQPFRSGARLRRRLAAEGLVASDIFLQIHENFSDFAVNHPEPARRQFARQQFSRALDYAVAAGAEHITILPGVTFKTESQATSLARAADELSWRVAQAAAAKLKLGVEPHVGCLIPTPERAIQLATLAPGLGFTLDYAHFTRVGIPDSRIEPLTTRATHFHARCARKGRLQSSFKANAIDFNRALRALGARGYAGWIALEYVWIDWEHCNEVDVLSETIQLGRHLTFAAKKLRTGRRGA